MDVGNLNTNLISIIIVATACLFVTRVLFKNYFTKKINFIWLCSFVVLSILSALAYFRLGEFHVYGNHGKHLYHFHEMYHYGLGAKYYPELGYFDLYPCTVVGLSDVAEKYHVPIPNLQFIRSTQETYTVHAVSDILAQADYCRSLFSEERYKNFIEDIRGFLALGWYENYWSSALFDVGFNPPPPWVLIPGTIARFTNIGEMADRLPLIDYSFLFIMIPLLLYCYFGAYGACMWFIVLGTNYLANMGWTGGSYFRHIEVLSLTLGMVFLKDKKFIHAGVFMAITAWLRIFPAVFAIGAMIPLIFDAFKNKESKTNLIRYSCAGIATTVVLLVVSTLVYGPQKWLDCIDNMKHHRNIMFVSYIGFKKLVVFGREMASNQNFHGVAGLGNFEAWNISIGKLYDSLWYICIPIQIAMLALSTWACKKLDPQKSALVFGTTAMFFLAVPANYYYIHLALIPAVFLHDKKEVAVLLALFALLLALNLIPLTSPNHIIRNGYSNYAMFLFLLFINLKLLGKVKYRP